jgi:hypothetical protein
VDFKFNSKRKKSESSRIKKELKEISPMYKPSRTNSIDKPNHIPNEVMENQPKRGVEGAFKSPLFDRKKFF